MIYVNIAVYDKNAEEYEPAMKVPHTAVAVRSWTEAIQGDTPYGKFPQDFELHELGTWDSETGKSTDHEEARILLNAEDVKSA